MGIKLAEIYAVSTDYILLGRESESVVEYKHKKELSETTRKTMEIIAIIVSTSITGLLFLMMLSVFCKYVLGG